jgi:alpha-beta hydrolase superfamily lysophospholipase
VLLFLASEDRIVDNARTLALCKRLPEGMLHVRTYAGADHSIQFDRTAELVRDMSSFLDEVAL